MAGVAQARSLLLHSAGVPGAQVELKHHQKKMPSSTALPFERSRTYSAVSYYSIDPTCSSLFFRLDCFFRSPPISPLSIIVLTFCHAPSHVSSVKLTYLWSTTRVEIDAKQGEQLAALPRSHWPTGYRPLRSWFSAVAALFNLPRHLVWKGNLILMTPVSSSWNVHVRLLPL